MSPENTVWIFHQNGARHAGGVFEDVATAEAWISGHKLTGLLTAYPLGEGCFDWAQRTGRTCMKEDKLKQKSTDPAFVGSFTTASQEHFHYEDGKRIA
jgi:hypothetical protein